MSVLKERPQVETKAAPVPVVERTQRFTIPATLSAVGVLAAAVGAYVYYASTSVTTVVANTADRIVEQLESGRTVVEFFNWTWTVGDAGIQWALGLMVGGGLLMTAGFAMIANLLHRRHGWSTGSLTMAVPAVLAFGGAVTYGLIWVF